jgi:hypothetical protein
MSSVAFLIPGLNQRAKPLTVVSCNWFHSPPFVFVMHDDDGAPNAPLHVLLSSKGYHYLVFLFCGKILQAEVYVCGIYLNVSVTRTLWVYVSQPFCASCCWPHLI